MSFSFTFKSSTKSEALQAVAREMAAVVQTQPVHAYDLPLVLGTAADYIGALPDDASQDIFVSINGSVSSQGGTVIGASISVSAYLQPRT